MGDTLQERFSRFTEHLNAAAKEISEMIGPEVQFPPALKARYEALTNLELAHMWVGNGLAGMAAGAAGAAQAPQASPPALEVLPGGAGG